MELRDQYQVYYSPWTESLMTLDLTNTSRLIVIKPQGSFCLSLASAGDYEYAKSPAFTNSTTHAWAASTYPTEPSPQPLKPMYF